MAGTSGNVDIQTIPNVTSTESSGNWNPDKRQGSREKEDKIKGKNDLL